jgi:hypothetical protein
MSVRVMWNGRSRAGAALVPWPTVVASGSERRGIEETPYSIRGQARDVVPDTFSSLQAIVMPPSPFPVTAYSQEWRGAQAVDRPRQAAFAAHGVREAVYAAIDTMSSTVNLATTSLINCVARPVRAPLCIS